MRPDGQPDERLERIPFGDYELVERIGAGGMGELWRAWDPRLERYVALKTTARAERSAEVRLEREARAIARLRHPSIVTVFDIGRSAEGRLFLVMELLEGEDLAELVARRGVLPAREAVGLMLPVVEALGLVHANGVVHRDVKPDNVFLATQPNGRPHPKLVDFGIARTADRGPQRTAGIVGTPAFMAPEQIAATDKVGPATDQWGACVTIHSLVTGAPPFHGTDVWELFARIGQSPLPFPRDGSIDAGLFAILARGTRKAPADRYPDMAALTRELAGWLAARAPAAGHPAITHASPSTVPAPTAAPAPTLDEAIRRTLGDGS